MPSPEAYNNIEEIDVIETEAIESMPVPVDELNKHTNEEEEVRILMRCLRYGRKCEPAQRFGVPQVEFSLQRGCLLRSGRVYIPTKLRQRVLAELHTGHFERAKMKALARAYCWLVWTRISIRCHQTARRVNLLDRNPKRSQHIAGCDQQKCSSGYISTLRAHSSANIYWC